MVIINVRNDCHSWIHNVGRIQTTSQPNFEHRDIHVSLSEVGEADGRDQLEVCGMAIQTGLERDRTPAD